ncbi:MAG: hypothetical protein ACTHJM_11830 [Marmoricola sp.]
MLVAVVLVGTSVAAFASTATAAGGEHGELLLKGPGTVYGSPGAEASLSVAPGVAASFAFEVRNTGSPNSQFNIRLAAVGHACAAACSSAVSLTAGNVAVTPTADGPNGYYTVPLGQGAVALYTLKITPNKNGATPGDLFYYRLILSDTAGNHLGPAAFANVNITRGKGTGGADQFASSAGTPPTSGNAASTGVVTAPSVAVDKTYSFTVKLMNDGLAPSRIAYSIIPSGACSPYFPIKIKQGTALSGTDVTTSVLNGTYQTASLAHGASVTLTITGTSLVGGAACLASVYTGTENWYGATSDSSGDHTATFLDFSPAG